MTSDAIVIDLKKQTLVVLHTAEPSETYSVSTSVNGPGESMDSECTPRGQHIVDEKIGAGCRINTVFVGRQSTGEIYDDNLGRLYPERDWILTRIMWLRGIEAGRNDSGTFDSKARYIYIHGTPDDTALGRPGSRGCIRMRNADIVRLFDRIATGTPVNIVEG